MRERRSRWTGCSPRFSLLTSLARLRKLQRLATAAGANSSKIITRRSAAISRAFAAERSRQLETAFSQLSTDRRAAFAARALLPKKFTHSELMFAPVSILESVK